MAELVERWPDAVGEAIARNAWPARIARDGTVHVNTADSVWAFELGQKASEIAGSLGLAASINHGDEHGVAQAQHGSAPDIEGQDKANPASLIGSVEMLLAWLGERRKSHDLIKAAKLIERALEKSIENPQWRTADLGGPLGTRAFAERCRVRPSPRQESQPIRSSWSKRSPEYSPTWRS